MSDPVDFQSFIDLAFHAIVNKQYWYLAALALIAFVAFLRWVVPKMSGRWGAAINSDMGAAALAIVTGFAGGLSHAILAGEKINGALILTILKVVVTASGTVSLGKKAIAPFLQRLAAKGGVSAAVILFALASCANGQSCAANAKQFAVSTGACVVSNVPGTVLTTVGQALGADDWTSQLESAGLSLGSDVVNCALQALISLWSQPANTNKLALPNTGTIIRFDNSLATARAQAWLAAHNVKVTP